MVLCQVASLAVQGGTAESGAAGWEQTRAHHAEGCTRQGARW
jgi:hypothetical protein